MLKRALFILLSLTILSVWPVLAQADTRTAPDYVPADFAGFVQLRLDDVDSALQELNITAFVASRLQPLRVELSNAGVTLDDLISLDTLFDAEGSSFADNILPWLDGEMVIAYRDFDGQFTVDPADTLMILPTDDVLESASALSPIINQQDLLERQVYRGVTIYVGDRTSIAITASMVFIGTTELVQTALDLQAGVGEAITASPVYHTLRAAINPESLIFAYTKGGSILPAVSGLLAGQPSTQALLAGFGGAISQLQGDQSFAAMLLNNGFEGAAAGLEVMLEADEIYVQSKVVFQSLATPELVEATNTQTELLNMIPKNALLAGSGQDAEGMIFNLITALPMSNFARELVGGLPISTVGTASEQISVPTAAQIRSAVNGYLALMEQVNGFSLQTDLLDHLSGDFAFALIPRPNDPVPVLNVAFDLLIVARVDDEEAAQAGASSLIQALLTLEPLEAITVGGIEFARLGADDEPIISLGTTDGLLIIATGNTAQQALDARRGDNRLTNQPTWKLLSATETPDLYLDSFAFLNTFFPTPGGAVASDLNRVNFAVYGNYLGRGLYELKLTGVVPNG
jgi:hypothetical protein